MILVSDGDDKTDKPGDKKTNRLVCPVYLVYLVLRVDRVKMLEEVKRDNGQHDKEGQNQIERDMEDAEGIEKADPGDGR